MESILVVSGMLSSIVDVTLQKWRILYVLTKYKAKFSSKAERLFFPLIVLSDELK